ncbi:GNAT family N-acetyltransferase [Chitinibacteraceae bacterium HSL-7]
MELVALTDPHGNVLEPIWLERAEIVHRQLRGQLPEDYAGRMREIFASGAHMVVAHNGATVLGLAVWRVIENTYEGRRLYVDDLIVNEQQRSQGTGHALLSWLEHTASTTGCHVLALDSGVMRGRAHAFYFREGLQIASFSFRKALL